MTRAVGEAHLEGLYAGTGDPWNFRTSSYEQRKFDATLAALSWPRYAETLEVGCGNGELAKRLCRISDRYVGLDAVGRALAEAGAAVPQGEFVRGFFPCRLPEGDFDLIVVSEILYFLDREAISELAEQLTSRWPAAEVLSVNYLGPSGNALQGEEAAQLFVAAMRPHFDLESQRTERYRIDRFLPPAAPPVT